MRLKIVRLIILLMFFAVAVDLVYLQVIRGPYYHRLSTNNRIRVVPLEGQRGRILDRNGIVLADNRLAFDVALIPQDIQDSAELFAFLGEILDEKDQALQGRFFQRKITPFAPVVIARDVDRGRAMVLEENRFRFPGLYIQESFRREYPFGTAGGHLLGYVGKISRAQMERLRDYGYSPQSIIGKNGVEEQYDSYLRGEEGGLQIEVNNRGQQVRLLSVREAQTGEDVRLSVDQRIQNIAQTVLGERKGSIVVMDQINGEILAMVSSPAYDPNVFVDSRVAHKAAKLFVNKDAPMLNRAIKGVYPPGSVFKTIVAVAGLVLEKIDLHTTTNCKGYYQLGNRRFRCAHVHGVQDILAAIMNSCNVFFYTAGMEIGPEMMAKYARMFGLGTGTHVDLPFEAEGNIPSPRQRRLRHNRGWYRGDTVNMSIGQGDILVTPLQMMRMMVTVARRGEEVQPHLVKKIGAREIVQPATVRQIRLGPEVYETVNRGLRMAVAGKTGTARLLDMDDFAFAGKTGTAQSGGDREHHAWFVGFDTSGRSRLSFVVFLEHGGSSYYAVKLARELIEEMKRAEII